MSDKPKQLSKRQLAVAEDLFDGKLDESEILEKHNLSISTLRKWLGSENFAGELTFRTEAARRQSEMIIARFAPAAAAKLVALTECEKEETRRKACLDVITAASSNPASAIIAQSGSDANNTDKTAVPTSLTPQLASRLLAVMTDGGSDDNE